MQSPGFPACPNGAESFVDFGWHSQGENETVGRVQLMWLETKAETQRTGPNRPFVLWRCLKLDPSRSGAVICYAIVTSAVACQSQVSTSDSAQPVIVVPKRGGGDNVPDRWIRHLVDSHGLRAWRPQITREKIRPHQSHPPLRRKRYLKR
jgi:hypothetical protein